VRRLTYLLASGVAAAGLTVWALQRPEVDRWLVGQLDTYLRHETGLSFQAERLEIHPFQGRVILHRFALGGELFKAERLEVDVDPRSLLRSPHIRLVRLESPRLDVDAQRLASIHLRSHPPKATNPQFRIDRLELQDGQARVDLPAWGLNRAEFTFRMDGHGSVSNQLWLYLELPSLALGTGAEPLRGALTLKGRLTDNGLDSADLKAHLGRSALAVLGSYDLPTKVVRAEAEGGLDLQDVLALSAGPLPSARKGATLPHLAGFLAFKAKAQGPALAPAWTLSAHGRDLQVKGSPLHPGTLQVRAAGGPDRIHLEQVAWSSSDGRLNGEGAWTRQGGTSLDLTADGVSLAPAAVYARTGMVKGLTGRFRVSASWPRPPWVLPDPARLKVKGDGQFLKEGQQVGGASFTLEDARLRATALDLDLPEATFHGSAAATLNPRGLAGITAEGEVTTDAAEVARTLKAWDVTDLDMSGPVSGRATFQWDPAGGIRLDGHAEVLEPRWHGARADTVSTDVALRGDEIRITGIQLAKGEGSATGDIWISWAEGPRDAEGIDMCFTAFRLPIAEGLKAGDVGDLPITGTASGWARLHGPLDHIVLEAQTVAEASEVYGLAIPAASTSFTMDIETLRLKATDVRIADSLDHLEGAPGPLNLRGFMDMDAHRETWTAELGGDLDSLFLGLPGPRVQGKVAARLEGPLTAPLGPSQAPVGTVSLSHGHLALEGQTLDDFEGSVSFRDGRLEARAGVAGKLEPVLTFQGLQTAGGKLAGDLRVALNGATADTAALSSRLTQGFLKDLRLDYRGQGDWGPQGLHWSGVLQDLLGTFEGFLLTQPRPGRFRGDLTGMDLTVDLEGRALAIPGKALALPASASQPPPTLPKTTPVHVAGWIPFSAEGSLDLGLEGSADLANLKTIVDHLVDPGQFSLMADLKPAGSAAFNLRLGGSLLEPTLDGRLDLTGGRIEARTYPQSVENVDFTAYFHGKDITIPQEAPLRGTLAQGALTAWGGITWGYHGLTDYSINAAMDAFQLRDLPEGLEIQGSFSGTLHGNDRDGGLLKGTLRAKNLLYQADINITDVILASAFSNSGGLAAMDPNDPLARIELDLDLQLARPWELDTNLLKLQGRPEGAFKILGTLAHPGLKGRMVLLAGGRLTNILPAGDLVLERGSVDFTDPGVFNPNVNLVGQVDVDPYLVTLGITGPLDHLVGTPSSTPALRPDEIFAILLDPSAVTRVGGSMGAPTQSSVNTGFLNQGAGLLSSLVLASGTEALRKTLGLDRVNFAILGGPNLSLTLEKNFDLLGHRVPVIGNYKVEGTQTTLSYSTEWRFGGFVLQVGYKQITGVSQIPGDTSLQGAQPSGEIRYTWTPK